jgi:glycosyltransferase EpsE
MPAKVSIIMGIYNCEKTLGDTLASILKQTYENWELILCNDGSSDNTYEIAKEYAAKDERILVICNPENAGLARSLNYCLEHAEGEYIMRHDGDDLMAADRIERQVDYMDSNHCDVCGSGAFVFDDSGIWGLRVPIERPKKNCMVMGTPFIHPSVIIKKSVLISVGGYSDNEFTRQRLEDYDLWIKLFEKNYIFHNIDEPLIYLRIDKNSYRRKKRKYRLTEIRMRLNACKRLNIPFMRRVFALKPLAMLMIPSAVLQKRHVTKSAEKLRNSRYNNSAINIPQSK